MEKNGVPCVEISDQALSDLRSDMGVIETPSAPEGAVAASTVLCTMDAKSKTKSRDWNRPGIC
jgi:hypothetical protein